MLRLEYGVHVKKEKRLKKIDMPKVPKAFLTHDKIKYVVYHIIDDFSYEEQLAIYFHCFADIPIGQIAALIELSPKHVTSALNLYSDRLVFTIWLLGKTVSHCPNDVADIGELLSLEL